MKSTVPVTISGFWYSSPSFFQNAVFAKMPWYVSRSFSLRILASSLLSLRRFAAAAGSGSGVVLAGICATGGSCWPSAAPPGDWLRSVPF